MSAALAVLTLGLAPSAGKASDASGLKGLFIPGVNLAGADFGKARGKTGTKAKHGVDYIYPVSRFVSHYDPGYFLKKGMKSFRLPFLWERLEPRLGGPFDSQELARLRVSVSELTARGAWVILDLHNYARYDGVLIGEGKVSAERFADSWRRLAREFADNPRVIFGLMNEPYDISTLVWVDAANAAVAAIRGSGAQNIITVAGNSYSSAERWNEPDGEENNGAALLRIKDPLNRVVFEAHAYLDRRASGESPDCVGTEIGVQRLEPFTDWLKRNGKLGFVGEFGAGNSPVCLEALSAMGAYMLANRDVYIGWSYWAAGPMWPKDYIYLIEPKNGQDAAQLSALTPYLGEGR